MEITKITQPQFQQLSLEEQKVRLQWNFQYLVENQQRVNSGLKVCKNYVNMVSSYNDAYYFNRTIRRYMNIFINPDIPIEYPNYDRQFTCSRLDDLCEDIIQLLQQFSTAKKVDHTIIALMYVTKELDNEQEQIIKEHPSK